MRDRLPFLLAALAAVLALTGCSAASSTPAGHEPNWTAIAFYAAVAFTIVGIATANAIGGARAQNHAARVAEAHARRSQTELERARLAAGLKIAEEARDA